MRKGLRSMLALVKGQMSDWLYSPRTIIMCLMIVALGFINAKSFDKILQDYSLTSHLEEAIFIYLSSGFGNLIIISMYFLIMVSEIPRRIPVQLNMLIRTNRMKWLKSQLIFCVLVVLLMIMLLTTISVLLTLPYLTPGGGWSMHSSNPDLIWVPDYVPDYIRVISPTYANVLSIAVLFAFWFTMILTILLFSLSGKPNGGLILYVSVLVLAVSLLWEHTPIWIRMMIPTNYATLSNISKAFPEKELQAALIALIVYVLIDVLLVGVMMIIVRQMDLSFMRKDKVK